jgi:hypothetical protein
MSPLIKLHLGSATYCLLLISLNWVRSVEYSRPLGITSETIAPVGLALLLSAAVVLYFAYRCIRAALSRLEKGNKVREGRWIESWSVIVYTLPLLVFRSSSSHWVEPDGTLAKATGGFGHALSTWVFLFAILGLLLFQILARLTDDDDESNKRPKLVSVLRAHH